MTARKDLLEAQAFQRRRLLAALVGGASREQEAGGTRPGRAVLGGTVVAVLVLAGAAVLHLLH